MARDKQAVALMAAQLVPVRQPLARQLTPTAISVDTATAAAATAAPFESGVSGVSMLQQLLEDLLLLGHAASSETVAASNSSNGGSTEATTAEQQAPRVSLLPLPEASVPAAAAAAGPCELAEMLNGACALLAGLAEHLEQKQLQELPIMPALQVAL
jgi:hypothetical protein